jgi:SAM-dependent methyltransferase
MGIYRDQVLPRLTDALCGSKAMERDRRAATHGLAGVVVEIGFAGGPNLPCYPEAVTKVLAVEPARIAPTLAAKRLASSPLAVEFVGLDGQSIPLEDQSCDGALSTFTLCTIPDPLVALREVRRVLKPGGSLHVLEHGLAPDERTRRWQHRLNGFERFACGGCELVRDIPALLEEAGFAIDSMEQRFVKGPRPWSYFTTAVATPR